MKKMTKLLSVILAFVMALSCMTMMASAAKTNYKTHEDLKALEAYSPYGTVTRLTAEERLSIIFDFLDPILADANITLKQDLSILGTLNVDLRSINKLCKTVDDVKDLLDKNSGLVGMAGIVGDVKVDTWQKGMTREGTPQLTIVFELFELLGANTGVINTVLTSGISLGTLVNMIAKIDFSDINNLVTNIPGAIIPMIGSMLSRFDDDNTDRTAKQGKTPANLLSVLQTYVEDAFSSQMATTSYRVDASGNNLGYTPNLPTKASGTSRYYEISEDKKTITRYDYKYNNLMGKGGGIWEETAKYFLDTEPENEELGTYLYRDAWGNTLQWYKADGKTGIDGKPQSQYLLPSVAAAINNGDLKFEINGADSLGSLLYKFLPYIFREMAPTVLNGSAKKLIAEAFDVTFTKMKPEEVAAMSDSFFKDSQKFYLWEYTNYKVIDGTPYYRYQDDFFKGEIPANISTFYNMIKWDWEITPDFVDEFIPKEVGKGSYILDNLNNLIEKAIRTMIADSWTVKVNGADKTVKRSDIFKWEKGGNDKLLDNILNTARAIFDENISAPAEIFDEYYKDAQFFDAMMNGKTTDIAVKGLIMELVKLLMPQIMFDDNLVNEPVLAIGAVVVRELCTQLMPTYDFDKMIYADYAKSKAVLTGKSSDYWLDTILYMGVNLGMYYLRNLADIGEDDATLGYYGVMANMKVLPSADDSKGYTFAADAQYVGGKASWLYMVDWVADWALSTDAEWCWSFGNFVDVTGDVDLTTYQNPFDKISSVLTKLFPALETLLNTSDLADAYDSSSVLAKLLKSGLVDSIVNLNVTKLLGMFKIQSNSILLKDHLADSLVGEILVPLLNNLFYKLAGNKNLITGVTNVTTLLTQANIRNFVVALVGALKTAHNNGLWDTVLPIVNFFVGWTTDPQKYSDPVLSLSSTDTINAWGDYRSVPENDYVYTNGNSATTTLTIRNNCSGMLLEHRNSSVTDHDYDIEIDRIYSNTGDAVSATIPSGAIGPGDQVGVEITIPYTSDKYVDISIDYRYIGKDGKGVGGTQTESIYKLISNVPYKNEVVAEKTSDSGDCDDKKNSMKSWPYMKNHVIGSLDEAGEYFVTIENTSPNRSAWIQSMPVTNDGPFAVDTSVIHGNSENSSLKADYKGYLDKGGCDKGVFVWEFYPYTVADENYEVHSGDTFTLSFTQTWRNGQSKSSTLPKIETTIYYYNVDAIASYVYNPLYAKDYNTTGAGKAWTDYQALLTEAAFLVNGPKNYDTLTTLYAEAKIDALADKLEAAVEALRDYQEHEVGNVQPVKDKLDSLETNPNRDINFQDYQLFEYFKYENERTAAREMIKNAIAPVPEKYIDSLYGKDIVDAVVKAQTNEYIKAAVEETVVEEEAVDFTPAEYTDVAIANQEALLQYYYNFMVANEKKTISNTFLQREVDYAVARDYASDEVTYSVDSWAEYEKALANAQAVLTKSGVKESEIFDAKYALMVAQRNLTDTDKSMKDSGYLDEELNELIAKASVIIENYGELYGVVKGVEELDAFVQLVKALGIAYNETDDGVDGIAYDLASGDVAYTGILYDRSAITFQAYDRLNTAKNKKAVDAAADKLAEALANFELAIKLVPDDSVKDNETDVKHDDLFVTGITPNTVPSEEELLARVTAAGVDGPTDKVDLVVTESKAGCYGTGTQIDLVYGDIVLVTYYVIIFGDVNGDGVVDAFDAIEVDVHQNNADYEIVDNYFVGADINHDGVVNSTDYAAIATDISCAGAITQTY